MSDPEWLTTGLVGAGRLWPREQETLRLMAAGCNNAEIADALIMTTRAAGQYVKRVYRRLGLLYDGHTGIKRVRAVLILHAAEQRGMRVGRVPIGVRPRRRVVY